MTIMFHFTDQSFTDHVAQSQEVTQAGIRSDTEALSSSTLPPHQLSPQIQLVLSINRRRSVFPTFFLPFFTSAPP